MNRKQKFYQETSSANNIVFKFNLDKFKSKDSYYVFYEGEDRKYYNSRIKKHTECNLISYDCSGKRGVLEVSEMIFSKNKRETLDRCMFFVDKDFGLEKTSKEIYETPEYSVENFYIKRTSLEQILIDEFGMSHVSKDYDTILSSYEELYSDFEKKITPVLVWYLSCKKNNLMVNLEEGFKINKLFEIKDDMLVTDDSVLLNVNSVVESYKNFLQNKIDNNNNKKDLYIESLSMYESKIDDIKNTIKVEEKTFDITTNLRGKYGLSFFQMFIENIFTKNKSKKLEEHYKTVYLNIREKNVLSTMEKYAITPNCLNDYIKQKVI